MKIPRGSSVDTEQGCNGKADDHIRHEKEQLAAVAVEVLGNEDRAAHIEAVLVKPVGSRAARDLRERAVIARPGVGVECRVAEVLNQVWSLIFFISLLSCF